MKVTHDDDCVARQLAKLARKSGRRFRRMTRYARLVYIVGLYIADDGRIDKDEIFVAMTDERLVARATAAGIRAGLL